MASFENNVIEIDDEVELHVSSKPVSTSSTRSQVRVVPHPENPSRPHPIYSNRDALFHHAQETKGLHNFNRITSNLSGELDYDTKKSKFVGKRKYEAQPSLQAPKLTAPVKANPQETQNGLAALLSDFDEKSNSPLQLQRPKTMYLSSNFFSKNRPHRSEDYNTDRLAVNRILDSGAYSVVTPSSSTYSPTSIHAQSFASSELDSNIYTRYAVSEPTITFGDSDTILDESRNHCPNISEHIHVTTSVPNLLPLSGSEASPLPHMTSSLTSSIAEALQESRIDLVLEDDAHVTSTQNEIELASKEDMVSSPINISSHPSMCFVDSTLDDSLEIIETRDETPIQASVVVAAVPPNIEIFSAPEHVTAQTTDRAIIAPIELLENQQADSQSSSVSSPPTIISTTYINNTTSTFTTSTIISCEDSGYYLIFAFDPSPCSSSPTSTVVVTDLDPDFDLDS